MATEDAQVERDTRVTQLDHDVRSLFNRMVGVETGLKSVSEGMGALLVRLDSLSNEIRDSKPQISAIWGPLALVFTVTVGLGGALATPYIGRINDNRTAIERLAQQDQEHEARLTQIETTQGIVKDRSDRAERRLDVAATLAMQRGAQGKE